MALDEATSALLAQMAEGSSKPIPKMSPDEARAMNSALADLVPPGPEIGELWDDVVPVPGGEIPIRCFLPAGTPRAVVAYFHGGGWVVGSIDEYDSLSRRLVSKSDVAVVQVGYRLAPEHRFPTAVEDSWAALKWIDAHRARFGDGPLVVAGESAGGNLSAVLAQRAKSAGGPEIAMQVLIYPVTDCDVDTATALDPANQLALSRDTMIWFWDHYVPDPADRTRPDASPLRAADVSGLAPALVITAEHDPLRDEGEAYAEKLRAAGVPVECRRFEGQMHGFFTLLEILPGAEAALDLVAEQISRRLPSRTRA